MTSSTKRKHVVRELLEDFSLPNYENGESIVKVLASPGSNLHEVVSEDGGRYLASLPTKFRKNVWIKRGDFVMVQPIVEGEKVKAEICRILYPQHIKHIKAEGHWPKSFQSTKDVNDGLKACTIADIVEDNNTPLDNDDEYDSTDSSNYDDIPTNTNHPVFDDYEEETDSSESGED